MKQKSFSRLAYDNNKKKKPDMKGFSKKMDQVIPWKLLLDSFIKPYPNAGKGCQPCSLKTMLRIYFVPQWYQLSDGEISFFNRNCELL